MDGREIYLDYVKLLAITMVLVYHCNIIQNPICDALLSCCVPLFFFVNGYLMLRKERDEFFMLKKVLKLYILFWVWGIFSTLSKQLIINESFSFKSLILHIYNLDSGYIAHLWFIQTLIILYFLYPLIKLYISRASKRKLFYIILFIGICSIQFVCVLMRKINLLAGWHGYSLLYFLLGYFVLVSAKKKLEGVKMLWYVLTFLVAWIFQTVLNIYILELDYSLRVVLYADQLVFGGYRSIFVVIMVVSLVHILSRLPLRQSTVVTFIGGNTLGIYLLHDVVMKLLQLYAPQVIVLGPFYPILLLFMCSIMCAILKKCVIGRYLIYV